jgi:hypothetical protein
MRFFGSYKQAGGNAKRENLLRLGHGITVIEAWHMEVNDHLEMKTRRVDFISDSAPRGTLSIHGNANYCTEVNVVAGYFGASYELCHP